MEKLNDHDRILLRLKQRTERNKQRYIKLTTLLMLHDGFSPTDVATALGIDTTTVHRYVRRFQDLQDVESYLRNDYRGRADRLASQQLMQLCDELSTTLYQLSAEVAAFIKEQFAVSFCSRHVCRLLKKLGYRFKKTRSLRAKADPLEQQRFLDDDLLPLLERTREDSEPVYFCDAVPPQYNTRPAYGWIAGGEEFLIPTTAGRQRVNVHGAVNVHDVTNLIGLESGSINSASTIALFEALEQQHPEGSIYVVCDNARYYHSAVVADWLAEHRICVLFLPAYSPNLNLIERLWKYLRKTVIDTTYYQTFQEFTGAVRSFFDAIDDHRQQLQTLLTPTFHIEHGVED